MDITASVRFITVLHDALSRREPDALGLGLGRMAQSAVADGWITPFAIETLLTEMDCRLWQFQVRELLRVFEIPTLHVFERPTRGARDAEGLERVSVVELARLLILLERAGFALDPLPLCQALAPGLGAKRLLTGSELQVYWRAARRSDEPLRFAAPKLEIGCGGPDFTTRAGYTVRPFLVGEPDSDCLDVSMLIVVPPALAWRAAKVRSASARRHLRKYLGEPRSGKSPTRKPHPAPAA